MKTTAKMLLTLFLFSTLLFTSCRTEEIELIQAPQEQVLEANSAVATLMQRIATNDGSNDNIIDNSNCFSIQLPVTVIVNGIELIINSESGFVDIEAIFDEFDDDVDNLQIIFPITVILTDFSEIVINNISDFNALSSTCNGENESDDDDKLLGGID